jgi:uncharacterized membrane protein (UPF0127 family)
VAERAVAVRNETRGAVLAARAAVADTFASRLVGLLGRAALDAGDGLWLEPCDSVHMLFMRFPIDVAFVRADGTVARVVSNLRPWQATWPVAGARAALELPAGVLAATDTRAGDRLVREAA